MLNVCLKCSSDHICERSSFTLQPPSMARSLSFCGGSGTGQFQYLCIRLLSSPLTSCCCRSCRHSTRTGTILTRIQPQRKRNAKFRVLSSRMVSSDRVFPTSICFPCECQTLLIRRNALSDSCLCCHIADGATLLVVHFVPGVGFSHCRWYRSPQTSN